MAGKIEIFGPSAVFALNVAEWAQGRLSFASE
jgi:hypothetical protein